MKRDMDLVRAILLKTEDAQEESYDSAALVSETWDQAMITYHVEIMAEAGLLVANVSHYIGGGSHAFITRLTWNGHEFLDAVRDDSTWNKTKSRIGEAVGSASLEVVKAVAVAVAREALGLK